MTPSERDGALERVRKENLQAIYAIQDLKLNGEEVRCPTPQIPRTFAGGIVALLRSDVARIELAQAADAETRTNVRQMYWGVATRILAYLATGAVGGIVAGKLL